ncbi:hypothetical protein MAR_013361 [Mya arenaria]|uniref:Uncharacterized protein n=1 Tax=Mya arenaria TaxID=6604 RepID=A0ABY7G2W5_MYAAR|nr:hypothetical protein MAR_013361 [Mya arenaria]
MTMKPLFDNLASGRPGGQSTDSVRNNGILTVCIFNSIYSKCTIGTCHSFFCRLLIAAMDLFSSMCGCRAVCHRSQRSKTMSKGE